MEVQWDGEEVDSGGGSVSLGKVGGRVRGMKGVLSESLIKKLSRFIVMTASHPREDIIV